MAQEQHFDTSQDYWKVFPEHKIIFADEYEEKVPSNIMWTVRLFVHPSSEFVNYSSSEKEKVLSSNYLRDSKYDWTPLQPLIRKYEKHCLTRAEKNLVTWNRLLEQKDEFLAHNKYDFESVELMEKILNTYDKQTNSYERVLEAFKKSEASSKVQGDGEESLLERGMKISI